MTKLKRLCILTVFGLCAGTLYGDVVLTGEHADGLYKAGEHAQWTIKAVPPASTTGATYTFRKNGVAILKEGEIDLSSGSAKIEIAVDEPCEIVLEVTPKGEAAATKPAATAPTTGRAGGFGAFRGKPRDGAIVDAAHLKPSLARPDDFDAWWDTKLAELAAIPPNPQLEKVNTDVAGIEYYKITLDNINATHVHGQLAKPAKEGKFPAILQLQYAGVYPLQRQWVTDRAKAGWLTLNVEAHDMPIDDNAAIQQMAQGSLKGYQAIGNIDREKSYFLRMYLGDCRALEYLASRPDWDGKTLVVMGDSMGGQQSFATVGLVGEKYHVTNMICHVPSGADVGAREAGRTMAYPNWANKPEVIQTARYFDIANFAPRIKATSLVSFGLFDGTSPPTGVIAAFNLINGPKEMLPLHSDHGGPGQQPREVRRQEWLLELVKGNPAPLKN